MLSLTHGRLKKLEHSAQRNPEATSDEEADRFLKAVQRSDVASVKSLVRKREELVLMPVVQAWAGPQLWANAWIQC